MLPTPRLFVGAPAHPAGGGAPGRRGLRWFWEGALRSLPFLIQLSPAPGLGGRQVAPVRGRLARA